MRGDILPQKQYNSINILLRNGMWKKSGAPVYMIRAGRLKAKETLDEAYIRTAE